MNRLLLLLLILNCAFSHKAHGQSSALIDSAFGINGCATIHIDSLDHCEKILTDSEGNIYFLGYTGTTDSAGVLDHDYIIGKVDTSGAIDSSFATNGILRGDFDGFNFSEITDACILDSAIYFCGNGGSFGNIDTQTVYIGKIGLTGTLDSSFGSNGFYSDTFVSLYNDIRSIHTLNDGRILIGGLTFDSLVLHREIAFFGRLLANGTRDSSFGLTGIRTWNTINGLQSNMGAGSKPHGDSRHIDGAIINDISVAPWGGYFLLGYFDDGTIFRILTMSIDTSGNFNTSYNSDGILIYDFNPTVRQIGLIATAYENKMVMGLIPGSQGDFLIQNVDSTGVLSSPEYIDFNGNIDRIEDMLLSDSGDLYFTGQSKLQSSSGTGYTSDYFTCFRHLKSSWQLDLSFADSGFFNKQLIPGNESGSHSITESPQGYILGGYRNNPNIQNLSDIAIVRTKKDIQYVSNNHLDDYVKLPQLWPNPTTGLVQINHAPKNSNVEVYSLDGTLLRIQNSSNEVDLSNHPSGLYILVISNQQVRYTYRIVLQD